MLFFRWWILMLKHHTDAMAARWPAFSPGKQLMMVANELNRAGHWIAKGDPDEVRLCYERALDLLWLTINAAKGFPLLRELCRAKEILLTLYSTTPTERNNSLLQAGLIALNPES